MNFKSDYSITMKKIIFILFIAGISNGIVNAQTEKIYLNNYEIFNNDENMSSETGEVVVIQDWRIKKLINKHIEYNTAREGVSGWRVQIFMGLGRGERQNADDALQQFKRKYKKIKTYPDYKPPVYKVKVGNFRTKNDALKFVNEISVFFPNAWAEADLIEFPKLIDKE